MTSSTTTSKGRTIYTDILETSSQYHVWRSAIIGILAKYNVDCCINTRRIDQTVNEGVVQIPAGANPNDYVYVNNRFYTFTEYEDAARKVFPGTSAQNSTALLEIRGHISKTVAVFINKCTLAYDALLLIHANLSNTTAKQREKMIDSYLQFRMMEDEAVESIITRFSELLTQAQNAADDATMYPREPQYQDVVAFPRARRVLTAALNPLIFGTAIQTLETPDITNLGQLFQAFRKVAIDVGYPRNTFKFSYYNPNPPSATTTTSTTTSSTPRTQDPQVGLYTNNQRRYNNEQRRVSRINQRPNGSNPNRLTPNNLRPTRGNFRGNGRFTNNNLRSNGQQGFRLTQAELTQLRQLLQQTNDNNGNQRRQPNRGNGDSGNRNNNNNGNRSYDRTKTEVRCYTCGNTGHYSSECNEGMDIAMYSWQDEGSDDAEINFEYEDNGLGDDEYYEEVVEDAQQDF